MAPKRVTAGQGSRLLLRLPNLARKEAIVAVRQEKRYVAVGEDGRHQHFDAVADGTRRFATVVRCLLRARRGECQRALNAPSLMKRRMYWHVMQRVTQPSCQSTGILRFDAASFSQECEVARASLRGDACLVQMSPDGHAIHRRPMAGDIDETDALPAGHVRLRGASFEVLAGPDQGLKIKMDEPTLSLGKGDEVDVKLSDPTISRRHLEFTASLDGLLVRDLGSRNGTWLGGCKLTEGKLVQDATLTFGQTALRVRLADGALDIELSEQTRFGDAIGASLAMRGAFAVLARAAKTELTVLLEGESGCGKEALAHAVHMESTRAEQPFVTVDCASIPENLIESELFGHERGAFTGAMQARAGAFESAQGGTIFLDELGELPLSQQAKLLRVLEAREVKRVGGTKMIPIDVRVIAATNRRLRESVRRKEFREDLYYRIAVLKVAIAPLRDRREDIPALALHFLRCIRGPDAQLPADLMQLLLAHSWPGNVRELRNVIERWTTFESANPKLLFEALPAGGATLASGSVDLAMLPYHEAKRRTLDAFEQMYFTRVLARAGGVVARAAALAQVPRPSFHRMVSRTKGGGAATVEEDADE